jgi:hypothetical protein
MASARETEGLTFSSHRPFQMRMPPPTSLVNRDDAITMRRAGPGDRAALERLAGRDSEILPADEFLVAEVEGEAWAAIGVRSGKVLADPFRHSGPIAELLRIRMASVRDGRPPSPSPPLLSRLVRRVAT